VLKETGNVLVFQEQITAICRDVFGLSPIDADQVRYAVGKKKKDDMAKWETVLYANGREKGIPEGVIKYFWDVCNASADYLFVRCLALDTVVETEEGDRLLHEIRPGDRVKAYDTKNKVDHYVTVEEVIESETDLYEATLEDGRTIRSSLTHKYLCEDGQMHTLQDVVLNGLRVITD